jgi:hypothetical protein
MLGAGGLIPEVAETGIAHPLVNVTPTPLLEYKSYH